ncbi:MAG: methylenetetrahydrofolate--tRNA-(uracil(54)-C(5))-methyltransferase (FADH(2)-oxidizing) TrmFO [Chloroflexi bacterium]|nr:MAG: methylenetetrahydrofolate--tRNA-(uracil(54)-C(5))-methyltransferase (FADH(2)-oxidizing) TrmFO [Chloroflexota bacterium]MBL1193733.1 methylenetetrahydrofolate--tRNA-(uracil(54)-C(5))-methyltransferase (FADH(2)-oxidizing) TrmFO [Chloroflexota bacterium]NOH11026.1 methylenetetrahydrofolate--tRNA-(uracil(54)-C(5))-methyltransferase (FADH(2)-oxidizing) TrmFO [Chloroflexota bacterium]
MTDLIVIGGGLAGSEAAWQAAEQGLSVELYEMRPKLETGAHTTNFLAELVCSNSLGSNLPDRAAGLLKNELRMMGSLLMRLAEETSVPAGAALAVDRDGFASVVTEAIEGHPNIQLVREEMPDVPDTPTIIASGPLTSNKLSQSILALSGEEHLYFYDAISPIVSLDSINMDVAFRASRYDKGDEEVGDYINCPMNKEEYEAFVAALIEAERIELKSFEQDMKSGVNAGAHTFFEGCLPIEIIAQRGLDSLAYGPMRPVGLRDPRTDKRPHAVVQLRQDNLAGTMYNLVGFQTNLKFPEQRRVLRMIPGLENGEFLRYGQMHRNTFIFSPKLLAPTLQWRERSNLFFAGQITGAEGYVGNIATGLLAGLNAARLYKGDMPLELPSTSMLGALCHYITHADASDFQPMKANFGIMPPLTDGVRRNKRQRAAAYAERALEDLETYLSQQSVETKMEGVHA